MADAGLLVEPFRAKVRLVHLVIHDVHLLVEVHHAHDLLVARDGHRPHRFLLRVRHRLVHGDGGRIGSAATAASSDRYDSTTANGSQSVWLEGLHGKNSRLRVKFLHSFRRRFSVDGDRVLLLANRDRLTAYFLARFVFLLPF